MSRIKFAAVTSDLVARKGEARPWTISPEPLEAQAPFSAASVPWNTISEALDPASARNLEEDWRKHRAALAATGSEQAAASLNGHRAGNAANGRPAGEDHVRRCTIKLSHLEYEQLGIVAVKKEISRQQVLHQAIGQYLESARREYRASCSCLGGTCNGDC